MGVCVEMRAIILAFIKCKIYNLHLFQYEIWMCFGPESILAFLAWECIKSGTSFSSHRLPTLSVRLKFFLSFFLYMCKSFSASFLPHNFGFLFRQFHDLVFKILHSFFFLFHSFLLDTRLYSILFFPLFSFFLSVHREVCCCCILLLLPQVPFFCLERNR